MYPFCLKNSIKLRFFRVSQNRLAEMRLNTAIVLSQLMDEQDKRETELIKRLVGARTFFFISMEELLFIIYMNFPSKNVSNELPTPLLNVLRGTTTTIPEGAKFYVSLINKIH